MRTPDPERRPGFAGAQSANDRFKAEGRARTGWSLAAAAVLHAAILAFWPALDASEPWLDRSQDHTDFLAIEWLALDDGLVAGQGSTAPAPVPSPGSEEGGEDGQEEEGDEEDTEGPEEEGEGDDGPARPGIAERLGGPAGALARTGSDGLREHLRREAPAPTVVEPEPSPPAELAEPVEDGEDAPSIDGGPSDLEAAARLDGDDLDLGRLTGLRPELAIHAPSDWVMLTNPRQVDAFMRGFYERGELDSSRGGSVLVTLWIDEVGSVEWAEIARSSGRAELDEVALELFSDVVSFRPARDRGVRVPLSVQFWVNFPWWYADDAP